MDELNKTITVAAQDPAFYGLDEIELEKRRKWTATARNQVFSTEPKHMHDPAHNGIQRIIIRQMSCQFPVNVCQFNFAL